MFLDRREAGQKLAKELLEYKHRDIIVLALPRGGVPVGYEIAEALSCPLDTIVARKIGMHGNPEFAIGAIAPGLPGQGEVRVVEDWAENVEEVMREETREMERRIGKYKSGSYVRGIKPGVVIVVDDGIATGRTAAAALLSVRAAYPSAKLIVAAPVGAPDSVAQLRTAADDVVILETPADFGAVSEWYEHFPQTSDAEVIECLEKASKFKNLA